MSRTIVEQNATTQTSGITFAYGGTWTRDAADSNAHGGSYSYSNSVGATCTITVAANSGYTGVLLMGFCNTDGTGVTSRFTVTVNGVAQADWREYSYTTSTVGSWTANTQTYYTPWYQVLYPPIAITPTNPSVTTIVLTVAAGLGVIDAIECFTSSASTSGALLAFGHSFISGVAGPSNANPTLAQRFSTQVATQLGMTETNKGVFGECLTNKDASGTVPAGWLRTSGTTDWWNNAAEVVLCYEGINDMNNFLVSDPGGGLNYCLQLLCQRFREAFWRMNLACPQARIYHFGAAYLSSAYSGNTPALNLTRQAWNRAIMQVAQESTVSNVWPVDTWTLLQNAGANDNLLALSWNGSSNIADNIHPSMDGLAILVREAVALIRTTRQSRLAFARGVL